MPETEAQFATFVEGALEQFGWRWCHFRPARTEKGWRTPLSGHKGFPDIVAVKDGDVIFVELKSEVGKLDAEQREWQAELQRVRDASTNAYTFVWRPSGPRGDTEGAGVIDHYARRHEELEAAAVRRQEIEAESYTALRILNEVADKYSVTAQAILSRRRPKDLVEARKELIWRLWVELHESRHWGPSRIGIFIKRDHSTVIHHLNNMGAEDLIDGEYPAG